MKKLLTILTICLVMASSAQAQVFITEGDYENPRDGIETQWGIIPEQWSTNDQANDFASIGEGVLLLTALGGAYLLNKRRKGDSKNGNG